MTATAYFNQLSFQQLRTRLKNLRAIRYKKRHIEIAISTLEQYIDDKSNRVMAIH